jgi:hypothetical protein
MNLLTAYPGKQSKIMSKKYKNITILKHTVLSQTKRCEAALILSGKLVL